MATYNYTLGDVGMPLAVQFTDDLGAPVNLSGRDCHARCVSLESGARVSLPLTPDADQTTNAGWATFSAWTGTEFTDDGEYTLRATASSGTGLITYPNDGTFASMKVTAAP